MLCTPSAFQPINAGKSCLAGPPVSVWFHLILPFISLVLFLWLWLRNPPSPSRSHGQCVSFPHRRKQIGYLFGGTAALTTALCVRKKIDPLVYANVSVIAIIQPRSYCSPIFAVSLHEAFEKKIVVRFVERCSMADAIIFPFHRRAIFNQNLAGALGVCVRVCACDERQTRFGNFVVYVS